MLDDKVLEDSKRKKSGQGIMSRRKLLATIGMVGVGLASTGLVNENLTSANGDPLNSRMKVKDLLNMSLILVTTIEQLKDTVVPDADTLYFVSDRGKEGLFYYDPVDTTSSDNIGTILVSSAGARFKRIFQGAASVQWFGAKGDGITDDTVAFNKAFNSCKEISIPATDHSYRLNKFQGIPEQKVVGIGHPKIDLYYLGSGSVVLMGFADHSVYDNIDFNCLEANLEWNRGELTERKNIVIRNCTIRGFRHDSLAPNAWGLYMKRSKNITIDHCSFHNNTQSDIAILEGSENITIINPKGLGNTLHLNLEPNNESGPLKCIYVRGGQFSQVSISENSYLGNSIESSKIENAIIDKLMYHGGNVEFSNSKIRSIENRLAPFNYLPNSVVTFASAIQFNRSLSVGTNLVPDPLLSNVSKDGDSSWIIYYAPLSGQYYERIGDQDGRYIRLNPTGVKSTVRIMTNTKLSIDDTRQYVLAITSKAVYGAADNNYSSIQCSVRFFDEFNNELRQHVISINRALPAHTTGMNRELTMITPPTGAKGAIIVLMNTPSTSPAMLDVACITFHALEMKDNQSGDTSELDKHHTGVEGRVIGLAKEAPTAAHVYANYEAGDTLYQTEPLPGEFIGWVCTESGTPGIWKGFGKVEE